MSQHFLLLNKYLIVLIVTYYYTRFDGRKSQTAYRLKDTMKNIKHNICTLLDNIIK